MSNWLYLPFITKAHLCKLDAMASSLQKWALVTKGWLEAGLTSKKLMWLNENEFLILLLEHLKKLL